MQRGERIGDNEIPICVTYRDRGGDCLKLWVMDFVVLFKVRLIATKRWTPILRRRCREPLPKGRGKEKRTTVAVRPGKACGTLPRIRKLMITLNILGIVLLDTEGRKVHHPNNLIQWYGNRHVFSIFLSRSIKTNDCLPSHHLPYHEADDDDVVFI